ncbi:MAG TPA: hypothetical protein VMB35_07660 [Methanomicrobiales archaeon]|nr:hypothetical protein [Methanomicrobiales archaeon]
MRCDRCGSDAIVFQRYSGLRLCATHFTESLDARARQTLRARGWMRSGDRIAVALSGGPGSSSLLRFLSATFGERPDMSLIAITIGEGGGAGTEVKGIGKIAEGMGIPWTFASPGESPEVPGGDVPREQMLGSLAKRAGATKIALGTNLNAIARSIFLHVIRGETSRFTADRSCVEGDIPSITPFRMIPAAELSLYASLNVPGYLREEARLVPASFEGEVREMLDAHSCRHPSAPFSIVRLADGLSAVPDAGITWNRDRVTGHG